MSNAQPFISIILPTYKVEKYIGRCLESCINQTYGDLEVIVVDDFGGDKSIEIARRYAAKDERIKIIDSNSNRGTFLARSLGISHANGHYILFLDPDDQLSINATERFKDELEKSPTEILFYNVTEDNSGVRTHVKTKQPEPAIDNQSVLKNIFLDIFHPPWGTPGKLYDTRLAQKVCTEFNDLKDRLTYSEDILFLFAAAKHAQSCRSITDHLYIYFKNDESITKRDDISSIKWKIAQSERSIELLLNISKSVTGTYVTYWDALHKTIGDIRSNYLKLTRFHPELYPKKSSYIHALRMAQHQKKDWKNYLRIGIYCSSLCTIKI